MKQSIPHNKALVESRNALADLIVSYYNEPTPSKLNSILCDASRIRQICNNDTWYTLEMNAVYIKIIPSCDTRFIRWICDAICEANDQKL